MRRNGRDGDEIEIDVDGGALTVKLSEEEIQNRRSKWTPPERAVPEGYLRRYVKLVSSANRGAVVVD